jgi:hypothetical protein
LKDIISITLSCEYPRKGDKDIFEWKFSENWDSFVESISLIADSFMSYQFPEIL